MRTSRTVVALIATALTVTGILSCGKDEQEAAKFERADNENFTREMSDITSFQLANGITCYVQEEHTQDQVAVEVLYGVGYMNEPKGQPQMAHLTEHLAIYCGSGEFKDEETTKLLTQDRGMVNAEASGDFIHFDYIVRGAHLENVLKVEASRMSGLTCGDVVLKREQEKVKGEIDKVVANPKGALTKFAMMGLNQVMYHGERDVPVRDGAASISAEQVRAFHAEYFRPDDMVVVIIGALPKADIEALVRKHLEPIARRPQPAAAPARITGDVRAKWDVPASVMYYIAPSSATDYRTRTVLTLFGAFFNQFMNASQELYGGNQIVYASNQAYRVGRVPFFIFAQPTAGRTPDDLAPVLMDHLNRAVEMMADTTRVNTIKGGGINFMTSTMLKKNVPDYPLSHHQVIGQEALNVGIKHLLREGRTVDEFIAEVNSITPQEFESTVKRELAPARLKRVTFSPR